MNEENDRIHELFSRVLQAAIIHQNTADKAYKEMINAADNLEQKTNQLRNQIHKEFEDVINSATNKAANDLIKKFNLADRYAERAAARYESVSFWTPIKYFAILTFSGAVILTGITKVMLNIIPTPAEIQERIEIKKQIEKEIDSLVSENKIELNDCDKRRCVKVNKNTLNQPYFGENGEVYLILDGY